MNTEHDPIEALHQMPGPESDIINANTQSKRKKKKSKKRTTGDTINVSEEASKEGNMNPSQMQRQLPSCPISPKLGEEPSSSTSQNKDDLSNGKKSSRRRRKKKGASSSTNKNGSNNSNTSSITINHTGSFHQKASGSNSNLCIWNSSDGEEWLRIRNFWLTLPEDRRRNLVKIEKDAVLQKMKEQQKHACSCSVCGRKRSVIEEELEVLYDAYYNELAHFTPTIVENGHEKLPQSENSAQLQAHPFPDSPITNARPWSVRDINSKELGSESEYSELFPLERSLTVKEGILTIADDLLQNNGQKFIELMEHFAERRLQREETVLAESQNFAENLFPDDNNSSFDYDDAENDDLEDEEDDEPLSEEQRMLEGRRMFQIFAARMFEQRVLQAYREHVAQERQQQLIAELEEESRRDEEKAQKKARDLEKKRDKKRQQKLAKEEAAAKREAGKKHDSEINSQSNIVDDDRRSEASEDSISSDVQNLSIQDDETASISDSELVTRLPPRGFDTKILALHKSKHEPSENSSNHTSQPKPNSYNTNNNNININNSLANNSHHSLERSTPSKPNADRRKGSVGHHTNHRKFSHSEENTAYHSRYSQKGTRDRNNSDKPEYRHIKNSKYPPPQQYQHQHNPNMYSKNKGSYIHPAQASSQGYTAKSQQSSNSISDMYRYFAHPQHIDPKITGNEQKASIDAHNAPDYGWIGSKDKLQHDKMKVLSSMPSLTGRTSSRFNSSTQKSYDSKSYPDNISPALSVAYPHQSSAPFNLSNTAALASSGPVDRLELDISGRLVKRNLSNDLSASIPIGSVRSPLVQHPSPISAMIPPPSSSASSISTNTSTQTQKSPAVLKDQVSANISSSPRPQSSGMNQFITNFPMNSATSKPKLNSANDFTADEIILPFERTSKFAPIGRPSLISQVKKDSHHDFADSKPFAFAIPGQHPSSSGTVPSNSVTNKIIQNDSFLSNSIEAPTARVPPSSASNNFTPRTLFESSKDIAKDDVSLPGPFSKPKRTESMNSAFWPSTSPILGLGPSIWAADHPKNPSQSFKQSEKPDQMFQEACQAADSHDVADMHAKSISQLLFMSDVTRNG